MNHGLMMVGPSGSGKSTAWRVLNFESLENLEGIEGVAHVIDPNVQCVLTFYCSILHTYTCVHCGHAYMYCM